MKKVILILVFILLSGCASKSNIMKTPEYLLTPCESLPLFQGTGSNDLLIHELELIKMYSTCKIKFSNLKFYIEQSEKD